jgi:hypothetical protein
MSSVVTRSTVGKKKNAAGCMNNFSYIKGKQSVLAIFSFPSHMITNFHSSGVQIGQPPEVPDNDLQKSDLGRLVFDAAVDSPHVLHPGKEGVVEARSGLGL